MLKRLTGTCLALAAPGANYFRIGFPKALMFEESLAAAFCRFLLEFESNIEVMFVDNSCTSIQGCNFEPVAESYEDFFTILKSVFFASYKCRLDKYVENYKKALCIIAVD